MKNYIVEIICCLMLTIQACDSRIAGNNSLKLIDSTVFKTEMSFLNADMGLYQDNEGGEDWVYFVNYQTAKKIKFYSLSGELIQEVPLDTLMQKVSVVSNIAVISTDSIVAIGEYTNQVYLLRKDGAIEKQVDLNEKLQFADGSVYELAASPSFMSPDKSIFLQMEWTSYKRDTVEQQPTVGYYQYLYSNNWKHPYLLKIEDVFSEKLVHQTGLNLNQIVSPIDSTVFFLQFAYYLPLDNKVLVPVIHSDTIYELNSEDLTIKSKYPIESKYTAIGVDVVSIDENSLFDDQVMNKLNSQGWVSAMKYNPYRQEYYVVINREGPPDFYKRHGFRPWILQIYNHEFKLLKEQLFEDNVFVPNILPSTKGVMIQKKHPIVKYQNQKAIFYEFEY